MLTGTLGPAASTVAFGRQYVFSVGGGSVVHPHCYLDFIRIKLPLGPAYLVRNTYMKLHLPPLALVMGML